MNHLCPCLSQRSFSNCCQPYINNVCLPDTPEKLMRSRYSAYSRGNVDYLVASHHASKRSANEKQQLLKSTKTTKWIGLIIHKAKQITENKGEVEFSAYYTTSENSLSQLNKDVDIQQVHEKSTFIKEDGQWFYLVGDFLSDYHHARNEICFCGSLKKYKRCHGR